MSSYWKSHDYNVLCDVCKSKRKRSQCRLTWDGKLACINVPGCWDPKHPNDYPYPKIRPDRRLKDVRPEPATDTFVLSLNNWENIQLTWENINTNWEDLT